MLRIPFFFLLVLLFTFASHAQFAGRYTDGRDYAVYFEQTRFGLSIRPVLWTATQLLKETSPDHFVVVDRTSRRADFVRDSSNKITGVTIRGMDGEGLELRRENAPLLPIELFLLGKTRSAAALYQRRGTDGLSAALKAAEQILERLPTKTSYVVAFLRDLAPKFENDPKFHTLLGNALVQAGDRTAALSSFRRAYSIDPKDESAVEDLYMLGALPNAPVKNGGWKLPFPLADVFRQPTDAEIKAVERDWASRDLRPSGVHEEFRGPITFDDWAADVRVVSHLVHGSHHYGAIVIPKNASPGCCAVIIDAKGVSPTYFPLTLENIDSVRFMKEDRDKFIYVVPSFRGEVMNVGGKTFKSEGDRRDALDGATDDAIVLLNVALESTPLADANRICAYGRSRGGNVALLLGIRDARVKCVVDVSGPTDWFYLMGTQGWTEQGLWTEGVRIHANTLETGGQDLERFMGRAIDGSTDIAGVRHNMIASSPLYFASRLPLTQMHYGLEDPSVPSRNGYRLVARMKEAGIKPGRYHAFFYPGQGHDTDRLAEPEWARAFIKNALKAR